MQYILVKQVSFQKSLYVPQHYLRISLPTHSVVTEYQQDTGHELFFVDIFVFRVSLYYFTRKHLQISIGSKSRSLVGPPKLPHSQLNDATQ